MVWIPRPLASHPDRTPSLARRRFFGGKMDDITALVAYVCPGEGAEAADPPADTPVAQAKL